ncbi:hypothetical protein JW979_11195 [bacterium]|nr:hypothetical protein [candidate division CSSED10-310 bacterium]
MIRNGLKSWFKYDAKRQMLAAARGIKIMKLSSYLPDMKNNFNVKYRNTNINVRNHQAFNVTDGLAIKEKI